MYIREPLYETIGRIGSPGTVESVGFRYNLLSMTSLFFGTFYSFNVLALILAPLGGSKF